jgi:hypothetical protein
MRSAFLMILICLTGCASPAAAVRPPPPPIMEPLPGPPCAPQHFSVVLAANGEISEGALARLTLDIDAARPCNVLHATLTGPFADIETVRAVMISQGFPPDYIRAAPAETDRIVEVIIEFR